MTAKEAKERSNEYHLILNESTLKSIRTQIKSATEKGLYYIYLSDEVPNTVVALLKAEGYDVSNESRDGSPNFIVSWA